MLSVSLTQKVSPFQDGQFTVDQSNSGSSKYLKYSLLYPLYLWVRAGLKTYVSDLWNVAEIMSYIFFITAFVCKVQMNFVQSEIIEDLFDELLTMNVQNGTDIAASEELLHQHQLTEGRLAVSGGQPHLSDLAIDPKSQAALAAVCTTGLDPNVRVSHLLLFVHTHPQLLPHVVQAVSAPLS